MSNEYSPTEARRDPFSSGPSETHAQPHQITGLMVLGFMIAFFAIIVGVNVFMAHAAISTFGGVETASSYQAGQMFERDVAMAKVYASEMLGHVTDAAVQIFGGMGLMSDLPVERW